MSTSEDLKDARRNAADIAAHCMDPNLVALAAGQLAILRRLTEMTDDGR